MFYSNFTFKFEHFPFDWGRIRVSKRSCYISENGESKELIVFLNFLIMRTKLLGGV